MSAPISQRGILIADHANQLVSQGMPVYDAIRLAVANREQELIAKLEMARERHRPATADDTLAHASVDALNLAIRIVTSAPSEPPR